MGAEIRLFLASFLVLFLELAVLRWTAAHVMRLGYFSNLALLGCFLGIGLGLVAARRDRLHLVEAFPLILSGMVGLILLTQVQVVVNSTSEIHFSNPEGAGIQIPMWAIVPLVFVLIAAVHVGPSQELGRLLRRGAPLRAYTVNILGSLAGIAAFAGCSVLGLGAAAWFAGVALLYLAVARARRSWLVLLAFLPPTLCGVADVDAIWSPYYRIQVYELEEEGQAESTLFRLDVNRILHQVIGDIREREPFYDFPYQALAAHRGAPPEVLIIGAGTGTDTAFALRRGVGHVDAVEIDPAILRLGVELHPNRPYRDPRVTTHATDGRVFMKNSDRTYDMVIFGLPDSLGLVSSMASVRLESFLFTLESLREARALVREGGLFVMYNYYRHDWLVRRLAEMLFEVWDAPPRVLVRPEFNMTAVLFAGPGLAAIPDDLGAAWGFRWADPSQLRRGVDLPTDDWPFLYLRTAEVPSHYLWVLVAVLFFSVLGVAVLRPRGGAAPGRGLLRGHWHLFFCGAAFMLLETASVVRASLFLGATWSTNAFTFFAILVLVLLANLLVMRLRLRRAWPWATLLVVSLAVAFLVPLETVLSLPGVVRAAAAGALMLSPVLFANVLFARFFRDEEGTADLGLAANILGTMLGGVLEYLSMTVGYGALYLVAAGLYAAAIFAWWRMARTRTG
ncbi:MAG: spermidine synthase [Pseudomonadota bacterium]